MPATHRRTALTLALAATLALGAAACSSDESGLEAASAHPAVDGTPSAAVAGATLEEQATVAFQGVQLHLVDHTAEPGSTTMLFQDGSWAALAAWQPDGGWCLAGVFDWDVTDVTGPTEFTVSYQRTESFPDCAATDEEFTFEVTGAHRSGGRTVFDGTAVDADGTERAATRTVCGTTWDHPDRCGIHTVGLVVPTPPGA
ncbi:MAG: hypothetical protein KDB10_20080 [Acidimicrobiales bacterium]|nr:hypothetical protein [Acidimicrobiales bacterium]MCB9371629.1 hypothetical protein [Microthrixaceae bacterium]